MAGPTEPGRKDWRVKRWVPFIETIVVRGADLTGATFQMQVRDYRDAPGVPRINLTKTASPAPGISVTVASVAGLSTSTIEIRIAEDAIEALLPFPASGIEPGSDLRLVWDMLIATPAFPKARWFEGAFIIVPGATQA